MTAAQEYDYALEQSNLQSNVSLSYDGKITFEQLNTSETKASISLYDSNSGNFASDSPVMSFNTNNSLTIRDPKTDFFKSIHEMIQSVVDYKEYPDASTGDKRGVGMENSIQMMDDLFEHVNRSHSIVGAQSNSLTRAMDRTDLLEISTMTLRSSTIDTDLAEASLNLTQLTLNYQAMLSTVGKVSQLSLVNYL
jgi:flagellar hook-associated protein 3 FlgL